MESQEGESLLTVGKWFKSICVNSRFSGTWIKDSIDMTCQ